MIWEQIVVMDVLPDVMRCVTLVPGHVLVNVLVRVVLTARQYVILIVRERAKVDAKHVVRIVVFLEVVQRLVFRNVL